MHITSLRICTQMLRSILGIGRRRVGRATPFPVAQYEQPSHQILIRLWGLRVLSRTSTAISLLRSSVAHRNTRTNSSLVAIAGATDSCATTRFAERARDYTEVAMSFSFKKICIGWKRIKNRVILSPPPFPHSLTHSYTGDLSRYYDLWYVGACSFNFRAAHGREGRGWIIMLFNLDKSVLRMSCWILAKVGVYMTRITISSRPLLRQLRAAVDSHDHIYNLF